MGILASLLGVRAHTPDPNDEFWWTPSPGLVAQSGVRVDADAAMKVSAVWACVRLISETIASLPLIVYQRLPDGGRERAVNHPLYSLLHDQPNGWQTAFEFVEMLTGHALLRGDAYARIVPGPRGPVDQLVPLHPDRVTPERIPTGTSSPDGRPVYRLRYRVWREDGRDEVVNKDQIFHLGGLSFDGVRGLSVIEYGREAMGLALAAEGYGARLFSQDAKPGGVLQHPGKLSEGAAKRLRADWQAMHAGLANAHKVAVLEEGMTWHQVGMTSEDAQFLQTREFQVEDVARWFRVPLHMISSTTKATSWGTGIEQLSIGFVVYTLLPWLRRWEKAIARDLIIAPHLYFAEFLVDALLRGNVRDRYEAYAVGRNWGWLSANDVRRMENMNPIGPAGDVYLQPLNMVEAGSTSGGFARGEPRGHSAPNTASAEAEAGNQLSAAHYHLLLQDAAARIVRKEIAALGKAARRCADDPEGWRQSVEEFYADHAGLVAQTLRVRLADAEAYVAEQRQALLAGGASVMQDWETRRVADLVALGLGGYDAAADAT